jgi:hydrogenase maturation protein HypF
MPEREARHITISGRVQGVGFRPFVYRLAHQHDITGWVRNVDGAVDIHAEGLPAHLERFSAALLVEAPPLSAPGPLCITPCPTDHAEHFAILDSQSGTGADVHLPPDGFVCADCLAELHDPYNRRHRYPFINCTQCGPRYTLITALPYDRPGTSMRGFAQCPECLREYENPLDRRFHAEPIACPVCGPHLQYVSDVETFNDDEAALAAAIAALRDGKIVAVKGVGGYHLLCDATNDAAIARLRARKPRPAKPLAVMFPDVESLRRAVQVPPELEVFVASSERPIVLLTRRADTGLSEHIAPGLAEIGCLLPYSPLHALLLNDFGGPLVATSGNLSGEPVLTDNAEAQTRLNHLADAFLHHDRPIVRPADDPVYRVIAGTPRPLRLGRGSAPLELELPLHLPEPVLALGSHMKNTLCLAWGNRAVVSPHIGELDTPRSLDTLAQVAADLQRLYQVQASRLIVDRHPGYGYRRYARDSGLPLSEVWHHHAHASALAWEFPGVNEWIVFAWDGVGLGEDQTLWGGEAFTGAPGRWQRAASFRSFRLPGGDKAGREPWRAAAALLWESGQTAPSLSRKLDGSEPDRGEPVEPQCPHSADSGQASTGSGRTLHPLSTGSIAPELLHQAWTHGINSPVSSSVGRLFDAAAALCGICTHASFEGEGPMRLEALATVRPEPVDTAQESLVEGLVQFAVRPEPVEASPGSAEWGPASSPFDVPIALPLELDPLGLWRSDWAPLLPMLTDVTLSIAERAARFHLSLAQALVEQAQQLRAQTGIQAVGLTGGVFQNRVLAEAAISRLEDAGFIVRLPQRVPVNDAGLSFGQVIEFLHS